MNNINQEYFAPIFRNYLSNMQIIDCGYWQLPFIPYTFPKYGSAPFKVFYFGRDTYFWCEKDDDVYRKRPEEYLKDNASYVNVDNMKKDWNKAGSFWGTVAKLHLQLMTGVYHHSIEELTLDDWQLLERIGYGNLFSLELPATLKKKKYTPEGSSVERTEYDDICDLQGYKALRNLAKPFENLKTIFSAYGEPDIVFVLSWTDKDDFFEGLDDYQCQKESYEEGFRSVFLSDSHKTKVIWSSHPSRFSFMRTNQTEMCKYLCDTANALLNRKK